ncbi:MAG TPA: hypothetical protein VEU94_02100 [Terriglobales bacterium]|nr:hypothetical protein [Terriglobales bacterium]
MATAVFDSGSSIGGAIAAFIVLWIYFRWGWCPAFMIPGLLGFLWLIAWPGSTIRRKPIPESARPNSGSSWKIGPKPAGRPGATPKRPGASSSNFPRPGAQSRPRLSPIRSGSS